MWERLGSWFRLLWDAGEKFKQQSEVIDELQEGNQQLVRAVEHLFAQNERLRDELRHEREKRADELEKIELRLRLQLSEELRRLPPPE